MNNDTTAPISCGISFSPREEQETTSRMRVLLSDVLNMKKSDWNDIIDDLIGPQKLCNVDSTDTANECGSQNSSEQEFYLI